MTPEKTLSSAVGPAFWDQISMASMALRRTLPDRRTNSCSLRAARSSFRPRSFRPCLHQVGNCPTQSAALFCTCDCATPCRHRSRAPKNSRSYEAKGSSMRNVRSSHVKNISKPGHVDDGFLVLRHEPVVASVKYVRSSVCEESVRPHLSSLRRDRSSSTSLRARGDRWSEANVRRLLAGHPC